MAEQYERAQPTPPYRILPVCWLVLLSILPWASLGDDSLGSRQVRRLENQVEKALERGDLDEARNIYRQIVEGTGLSEPRRADALWYLALDALATHDDPAAAAKASREYLETLLAEHSSYPLRGQVRALSMLLDQLEQERREAASLARRLAEREQEIAEASAQLAELEASDEEAKSSLEGSIARLRRQLSEARREHDLCAGELEKTEQALEKLKDALVKGGD